MKKKIFLLFTFIVLLFNISVKALESGNYAYRNVCPHMELALANKNDTITSIACYDNYALAKKAMDEYKSDDVIILEKIGNITKIVDAKYGMVYLDKGDTLTNVFPTASLKDAYTYMNNYSAYGGTDGALIDINYVNKAAKIKISGVTGWIPNNRYVIVPLSWVKSSGFYYTSDKDIIHYYAKNIQRSGYTQFSRSLGPRPDYLESNKKYYSYDGIYLYNDLKQMLIDYKNNTFKNSVNIDNPYYNYYLYLPHRSRTNYTVDDIDVYIRNVLNFRGSTYGKTQTNYYSALYGQSDFFLNSEKLYGANALSVLSLSRNESANGKSYIATMKNNIFGHNAVDGSAYNSSTGYLDVRSSIYSHGYGYINYMYSNAFDWRYFGGHFGNKNLGMNVKYASDPYWGEKAANYYYLFDRDNGLMDYNYYQLAISNNSKINARTLPNTHSNIPYNFKCSGIPVIILEEVEGEKINGTTLWYKIQADINLNSNRTGMIPANRNTWPEYNWNSYVYVHSSYFTKINKTNTNNKYPQVTSLKNTPTYEYNYKTYADNYKYSPIVGLALEDIDCYHSSSLINKSGKILKNSYLTILSEAKKDNDTRYLVITDYSKNQKNWISGSKIKLVKRDLLGYVSNNNVVVNVYDKPNGKVIGNVYTDNYLPIVDKETVNNDIWAKVQFKINPLIYGYIKIGSNMSYTFNNLNTPPIISISPIELVINNKYNLMDYVKGHDKEDGDISSKIKVIENKIDITKPGQYTVTYSLTDSYGVAVTKQTIVRVNDLENRTPLFMYHDLSYIKENTFNFSGFLGVKGMDNKVVKHQLVFINQVTNEEFIYPLTNWQDYPYDMSSLDDKKPYDYSGGWFNTNLDLINLPSGDYNIYAEAICNKYKTRNLFTNIAYGEMTRRAKSSTRGYLIEIDYSTNGSPILFSVRDNGLLSYDIPKTIDPMYNFFTKISLNENKLSIRGTSHNYGIALDKNSAVERYMILENVTTFKRYIFSLGSIIDGDYKIILSVPDNCDKTRAWYDKTIDLSGLLSGTYAIYIKNTVLGKDYFGELIDVGYTDFSKINNSKYSLKRNDNIRLRMELVVN